MSYECLESSQPIVDLDRAFQSRSLRSRGTECSTKTRQSKWRRKLRGDRGYEETPRKRRKTSEKDRVGKEGSLRWVNYRGIIKSVSLFTTLFRVQQLFSVLSGGTDSLQPSHDSLSDFHDFSNPPPCASVKGCLRSPDSTNLLNSNRIQFDRMAKYWIRFEDIIGQN